MSKNEIKRRRRTARGQLTGDIVVKIRNGYSGFWMLRSKGCNRWPNYIYTFKRCTCIWFWWWLKLRPCSRSFKAVQIGYRDLAKITQVWRRRRRTLLGLVSCNMQLCDRLQRLGFSPLRPSRKLRHAATAIG